MKLLVTGLSGFVGRALAGRCDCEALALEGKEVDLREYNEVCRSVASIRPDAVIHLAAQSFVPAAFENPRETFDVNFFGTYNLLCGLKQAKFQGRFLFVGSGDTYGRVSVNELPIMESAILRPQNPYAVSKVAAEALCYQWSQTDGFQIVLARPFNHIGAGQSERFAIADFARQVVTIKRGLVEPVIHAGDIDVTRDFTDVRDVVEAYLALLRSGKNGEVYNICSGVERSVRSLIQRMALLAEIELEVRPDPKRYRPLDQRRIYGSNSKVYAETGWKPRITIESTLSDILAYWERNLNV